MTDDGQRAVIALRKPSALVLAGPGCGKTHILARRVLYAHREYGIPFGHMACLTFTNRAAREMLERVSSLSSDAAADLFVGNLHRFCLRLLFENELIHHDSTILDDNEFEDYCRRTFGYTRQGEFERLARATRYLYQLKCDHPARVRLTNTDFTDDTLADALEYLEFKKKNNLIDFDEILMRAYTALRADTDRHLAAAYYPWVQVDEVQDLTALHLAIIDEIAGPASTRLYLGDEQQAIFSFLGAGGAALDALKERCHDAIYHLGNNYRSSPRLLDITNRLAHDYLGIAEGFLPVCRTVSTDAGEAWYYNTDRDTLPDVAAAWVSELSRRDDINTISVLVRTNQQGQEMSDVLTGRGIAHIFPGRNDVMRSTSFKTIWSHLSVALNDCRFQQWAEIIYRTKALKSLSDARRLVSELERVAFSPAGLLDLFAPSDCERLCSAVDAGTTVVVFDTETTGLDIANDDIVQLSAVRMRNGEVLEGQCFNVFIDSALPLPNKIGGAENPLLARYAAAERLCPAEAFSRFADFVGDDAVLAGHNTDFDMAMLRNNMTRRTVLTMPSWTQYGAPAIDSLRLARLLLPRERSYRLGALIGRLGLDGENTHTALDDALAAASLLRGLLPLARRVVGAHRGARSNAVVLKVARILAQNYKPLFDSTRKALMGPPSESRTSLSREVRRANAWFAKKVGAEPLRLRRYVVKLIDNVIVNPLVQKNFYTQLSANLNALLTYNEGDFFANNIVDERIRVMTIHKAKGLESDAVIVYDASRTPGRFEDYLRVLYVALSRARKVLVVGAGDNPGSTLDSLAEMFDRMSHSDIRRLVHRQS